MSAPRVLGRREFLLLTAAFGASLATGGVGLGSLASRRRSPAAERLAALLEHRGSARAIGAAYLAMTPSESRIETLVEGLSSGLGIATGFPENVNDLRARLLQRMQRDFTENATVCVDGWVLSRTEARLCALAALV